MNHKKKKKKVFHNYKNWEVIKNKIKMDSLHFIPNNILTRFLKELTKCKNDYQ